MKVSDCVQLVKHKMGSLSTRVSDDQIKAALSKAVREYSRFNPVRKTMDLALVAGTQRYSVPADCYMVEGVLARSENEFVGVSGIDRTYTNLGSATSELDGLLEQFEVLNPSMPISGDMIVAFWAERNAHKILQVGSEVWVFPMPDESKTVKVPYLAYHLSDTEDYNTATEYDTVAGRDIDDVCEYAQGECYRTIAAGLMATGSVDAAGSVKQDVSRTAQYLATLADDLQKCYPNKYIP